MREARTKHTVLEPIYIKITQNVLNLERQKIGSN
jgi:hypothetical protein